VPGYALTVIQGNLGRDPELRYTPSGKSILQFSVAVSRAWKQDGEWQEETTWYRCVLWGEQGERLAEQLHKGSKVLAQGRIQTRTYEDKDGNKKDTWELNVDRIVNLDPRERDEGDGSEEHPRRRRQQRGSSSGSARTERTPESKEPTDDLSDLDDLPFP
jgi:single-strand DNA-binding protein